MLNPRKLGPGTQLGISRQGAGELAVTGRNAKATMEVADIVIGKAGRGGVRVRCQLAVGLVTGRSNNRDVHEVWDRGRSARSNEVPWETDGWGGECAWMADSDNSVTNVYH